MQKWATPQKEAATLAERKNYLILDAALWDINIEPVFLHFLPFVLCFVFNRMNGTVTLPAPFPIPFLPKRTILFSDVFFGISWTQMVFRYAKYLNIGVIVWYEYNLSVWGFFVQYMDKNRPLPRGSAFDAYREQDFKRRQAEGFPKPIYPNLFYLTDESCGYIYGTNELKKKITRFQVNHLSAYEAVLDYINKNDFHSKIIMILFGWGV